MGYKRVQGITGGEEGLKKVTKDLQGVTGGDKGLQRIQGEPRGYKGLHGVTGAYKG